LHELRIVFRLRQLLELLPGSGRHQAGDAERAVSIQARVLQRVQ
jgi:hypothetical protein